ncbi:uncharacterized protein LOC116266698 [Nymphaea colorata]|uniref:uncharacterized protein LOC116266698 n=1 Tax=Nymphaea colorata TaxID=210225 RepID=UPI00129EE576|nr:uncharacterized protein LOC116266698 [Nymphaea colorata]
MIEKQSSKLVHNNRLRLKASVDVVRWLTFQACTFRGHDESSSSMNQGNFIEFIKLSIQDLRGQGYDGASNMRASKEVGHVHKFFEQGLNQIRSLQRPGDTRWRSHFVSAYMDVQYFVRGSRFHRECNFITVRHHYHVDIFIAAIDSQLVELNSRFNENSLEILCLISTFDPRDQYESFNAQDAYTLAEKFYPEDFLYSDLMSLNYQLKNYKNNICHHPSFQNLGTLSDVCQTMVHSRKSERYPYVYRLLSLILTLPVSTATTERAFSAMKLIKTRLRNKIEDEFFADCLYAIELFACKSVASLVALWKC